MNAGFRVSGGILVLALAAWTLEATAEAPEPAPASPGPSFASLAGEAPAVWSRLRRHASAAQTALVTLVDERRAGSCADLALEMGPPRPRFTGTPPLLEGLEGEIHLVRNRIGPQASLASVRWPARRERSAA